MKLKFYFLLLAVFIAVQGFTGVTVKITSPTKNQLVSGDVLIKGNFSTTHVLKSLTATILNRQVDIEQNFNFTGFIDLKGLPQDTLKIVVKAVDIFDNTAMDSVTIVYDNPPLLSGNSKDTLYLSSPYLHVVANCLSDSGHCIVKVTNPANNQVLAQGLNKLDTLIDVSEISEYGYWIDFGNTAKEKKNYVQVWGTDKYNLKAYKQICYVLEPSPYLEKYNGPVQLTAYIEKSKPNCCDPYLVQIHANNLAPFLFQPTVMSFNNNFLFWHQYKDNNPLYRRNLRSGITDTLSTSVSILSDNNIIDSFGNFATGGGSHLTWYYNDSLHVLPFTDDLSMPLGIYDKKIFYLQRTYALGALYLYDGIKTTVVDSSIYIANLGPFDYYPHSILNNNFIAYYKAGRSEIWLADSALHTTKIASSHHKSSNMYLFEATAEGDVAFGEPNGLIVQQQRAENGDITRVNYNHYISDRLGHVTQVASSGTYWRNLYNNDRLIKNIDGYYKINLSAGKDSLITIHRETNKDSSYLFTTNDFDNAFKGPGYLFKVKITGLPKHGTLYTNNLAVPLDTVINHGALKRLLYKPNAGFTGKDTIYWNASNGYAFTNSDTIIVFSVIGTLPVTLTNLTAKNNFKTNLVSWQTTQEVNSAYFDVQKSTDNNTFNTIGTVAAKGNSSITSSYAFTDVQPATGNNYYRLKIVDKDGQYSYSKTVLVKTNGGTGISMYPNPAKTSVQVNLAGQAAGRYSITVYNTNGKAVLAKTVTIAAGSQTITLPVSSYAGGVYTVTVVNGEGQLVASQKVVKE